MRLGLLADIHEHLHFLTLAISALAARRVDRVVVLGDVFETGRHIDETVELLRGIGGVWGNHDFGLCLDPEPEVRARVSPAVIAYFRTLSPHLVVDDVFFQHIEPWRDASNFEDLWSYAPLDASSIARAFAARPDRVMMMGHVHRGSVSTLRGREDWDARSPIALRSPERFLVTLPAVRDGFAAVYDTRRELLEPIVLE